MKNIEHQIQASFFQWVRIAEKTDDRFRLMCAIPNGGKRSIKTAVALKAEGVRPGVPDVLFLLPSKNYCGLAIEFKRPKNKPTEHQRLFMEFMSFYGWKCAVHTDAISAIEEVRRYLSDQE